MKILDALRKRRSGRDAPGEEAELARRGGAPFPGYEGSTTRSSARSSPSSRRSS